jgi:Ubiquitin carboxyl-terminal hydrolase.
MVTPSKNKKASLVKLHRIAIQKENGSNPTNRMPHIETIRSELNTPVKLMNEGVNVCFFNAVIQMLYSLRDFRFYIEQTEHTNAILRVIQDMFKELNAKELVRSSIYIQTLQLPNYTFGTQHDALECISHILDHCFPDGIVNVFQINIKESVVCESIPDAVDTGCNKRIEMDVSTSFLCLDVADTREHQTESLLDTYFSVLMVALRRITKGLTSKSVHYVFHTGGPKPSMHFVWKIDQDHSESELLSKNLAVIRQIEKYSCIIIKGKTT